MARAIFAVVAVGIAFWVYTIVDVALTARERARAFPKTAWVFIVLLLPVIGGIIWLVVGKARFGGSKAQRVVAPDDDPSFLRTLNSDDVARRAEQEERLRRLEQELAELDDDPPAESGR